VAQRTALGQGRLWPAGGWHSRSTPSFGIPRAFTHLRFVPGRDLRGSDVIASIRLFGHWPL
jgi:hypothetical protein